MFEDMKEQDYEHPKLLKENLNRKKSIKEIRNVVYKLILSHHAILHSICAFNIQFVCLSFTCKYKSYVHRYVPLVTARVCMFYNAVYLVTPLYLTNAVMRVVHNGEDQESGKKNIHKQETPCCVTIQSQTGKMVSFEFSPIKLYFEFIEGRK